MRPVLFQLPDAIPWVGGAPVFTYGAVLGLAYLTAWTIALSSLPSAQRSRAALVFALTGGVGWVGARLLGPWLDHSADPLVGGTLWPGLLLGGATLYIASRLVGASWRRLLDAAAVGTAFGVTLGRLGCFLHGCDYGVAAHTALGVVWPSWSGDFGLEVPDGALAARLPVQLLEAGLALGLGVALLRFGQRRLPGTLRLSSGESTLLPGDSGRAGEPHGHAAQQINGEDQGHPSGDLRAENAAGTGESAGLAGAPGAQAAAFFAGYALIRLVLEPLRGDAGRGQDLLGSGLSTAQVTSIVVLIGILALWRCQRGRRS